MRGEGRRNGIRVRKIEGFEVLGIIGDINEGM